MPRASRGRDLVLVLMSLSPAVGAGCGPSGGSITLDEAERRILAALCRFEVSCHEVPDMAACMAVLQQEPGYQQTLDADIASGKVAYDGVKAQSCVSQYESLLSSCSRIEDAALNALSPVCDQVLVGTVAAGGACFFNEECAGGGSCQVTDTSCSRSVMCCAGTCVAQPAPIPVGGDCSAPQPNQSCAAGSYCNTAQSGSSRTCVAQSTVEGTPCTSSTLCASPMYCAIDPATGMGTCKRAAATGAACSPSVGSISCDQVGDYCDATTSKCTPRVAPGSTCDSTQFNCVGYATCVGTTCVARPVAGQACDPTSGPSCLGSLPCDTTTNTCPALPTGGVCN
jgi:hypothetical protein